MGRSLHPMCCIFDGYQFSMKDTSNTSCSSIYLSTEIAWPSNENGSLFMTLFKSCNGQKHRLPMHAGLALLRNVIYSSSKEGRTLETATQHQWKKPQTDKHYGQDHSTDTDLCLLLQFLQHAMTQTNKIQKSSPWFMTLAKKVFLTTKNNHT